MFLIDWIVDIFASLLHSVIFLLVFALVVFCAFDCFKRRFREPWHKVAWLLAILFPPLWGIGAMAYLIFGREQGLRY